MEDSMLMEILKEMQKKYRCIAEIEHITRDMGDSLSRNDKASVQLLLEMRQEEMDKTSVCDRNIHYLLEAMPAGESMLVSQWMKGKASGEVDGPLAEKLAEKGNNIKQALKRTIEIDRHISTRLAGKDSFYK